jgi:hypothetical protein
LNRRNPEPSGFEVTVYGVERTERPAAMRWVYSKFEKVVKIVFVD